MDNLEQLWLLSAELEGALLVMKKKGVALTSSNNKFFIDKIAKMQHLLMLEDAEVEEPAAQAVAQTEFIEPEEQPEALVQEVSVAVDEPQENTQEAEEECVEQSSDEEYVVEVPEEEPEAETIADEPSEEEIEQKEIADNAIFEEQEDADITPEEEPEEETSAEPAEESEEKTEEKPVEEVVSVAEPEKEPVATQMVEVPETYSEPASVKATEPIRLEEKLAQRTSRDISKAFNLNDKFRFRRFLFGNNSSQYNEALELISEMDNYDETADYFFTQYGWNPEDENVKAFMDIVKKHFN